MTNPMKKNSINFVFFGTPAFAIIALNIVSVLLAVTGTFEQLLTYVVFTGWIFYALGAASIFVYRRRQPRAERPFRVPGYPITPVLFVLSAAIIVINATVTQPARAAVGIAIVLSGAPAYLIWRRRPPYRKAHLDNPARACAAR